MATARSPYFERAQAAIERFDASPDISALNGAITAAIAPFGYSYHCFAQPPTAQRIQIGERKLLMHWPADWSHQYDACGFAPHDAVARAFRTRSSAFRWSEVSLPTPVAQRIMTIARDDFGMARGVGVPLFGLHGYEAGASFAGMVVDDSAGAIGALQLIAIYAHNQYARLRAAAAARPALTERQREILQWVAVGKTNWDIGRILDIAEDTVSKTMAAAMMRLGAHTRAQAVAEALRRGEIPF